MHGNWSAEITQFTGLDLPMILYDTFIRLVAASGLPLSGPAELQLPVRTLSESRVKRL